MKIVSIDIVANILPEGAIPQVGKEVEQHLFFSRNGSVFFMAYEISDQAGNFKRSRLDRLILEDERLGELISFLADFFFEEVKEYYGDEKDGSWRATLTDEDGQEHKFTGPLTTGYVYKGLDVSQMIRDVAGFSSMLALDGEAGGDRINRIFVEYKHRLMISPQGYEGEISWDYSESLLLDRARQELELVQKVSPQCVITHKYRVEEGIDVLLAALESEEFLSQVEGNLPDVIEDPKDRRTYNISVEFENTETLKISGSFDQKGLPTDWHRFADKVLSFINFYGQFQMLMAGKYSRKRRREGELVFYSVIFGEEEKTYYYLGDDDSLELYDEVWVPVGEEDEAALATIVEIEYFKKEDSPYPFDKLKKIIGSSKGEH